MVGWYDITSIPEYCVTVSKRTVEMWIKDKGLRFVRVRGKRFVKREWLDQFLEDHEQTVDDDQVDRIVDGVLKDFS